MRRFCCLLLMLMSIAVTAQADLSAIETAYTYAPPEEAESTASTWHLTIERYSGKKAEEALAYFAPGVQTDLERESIRNNLLFYLRNNPVTLSTKTYRSERVAPLDVQEPLLTFLGWTNVCEMTSIRVDEAYALYDISGLHAPCTFEEYMKRYGFAEDVLSEVHVLWQTIDGRLVYPYTISKGESFPIYAELACDRKRNFTSAQFGNHILSAEPGEQITATISPEAAAEKVVQEEVERWKNIHGVTGTIRITADQVMQGYWVDDKDVAHPGWLVHCWSIQSNEAGERVYVGDFWHIVDFATGSVCLG